MKGAKILALITTYSRRQTRMPFTRSGKSSSSSSFFINNDLPIEVKRKSQGFTVTTSVDFSSFAFKGTTNPNAGEPDIIPDDILSSNANIEMAMTGDELGVPKNTTTTTRRSKRLQSKDPTDNLESTIESKASSPIPVTPEIHSSPISKRPKKCSNNKNNNNDKKKTPPLSQSSKNSKKRSNDNKKKSSSSTKSSNMKRVKIEPGSLEPPVGWESLYELVEELREDRTAPVDTDGGEALPQKERGEVIYRFQVLVALMLSSQTKDAVVGETMRKLQKEGLDVENINDMPAETLNALIGKVGFHNNKTKYLKQTAKMLIDTYDGDIPKTSDEMMKLPGVGPKMAYIIESIVFGVTNGIGVDTHMHRMFNSIGWVKSNTPEQTRVQLEGWLPADKWREVNVLWVGFGQESQQQKEKMLKKALACSKPHEAMNLLKRVGLDLTKEAKKFGLEKEVGLLVEK